MQPLTLAQDIMTELYQDFHHWKAVVLLVVDRKLTLQQSD